MDVLGMVWRLVFVGFYVCNYALHLFYGMVK